MVRVQLESQPQTLLAESEPAPLAETASRNMTLARLDIASPSRAVKSWMSRQFPQKHTPKVKPSAKWLFAWTVLGLALVCGAFWVAVLALFFSH